MTSCPAPNKFSKNIDQLVGNSGKNDDMYARIDNAFDKSQHMEVFQQKLSGNMQKSPTESDINRKMDDLILSSSDKRRSEENSSEKKINNALYTKKVSYPQEYPLDRNQQFNSKQYGSELLENYEQIEEPESMSASKIFLSIILIALLIYGVYYIYKKKSKGKALFESTEQSPFNIFRSKK